MEGGSAGQLEILRYIVGWVSSGRSHSGGLGAIVATKALIEAGLKKNPVMLFEGSKWAEELTEYFYTTKSMVKEIFKKSKMEVLDKLIICEMDIKSYIQNYMAGILRGKYPKKVILVANFGLHKDVVQIELRRNPGVKVNLRDFSRKVVKGLKASAGGHPEAAGIRIPKKDWAKFKKRVLELLV